MKEKVDQWKAETGLGFGLYGTPSEGLCDRFCRIDKKKFGEIKDITDKGWYTNSYHYDVREEVDAFTKLEFESEFQSISTGGCISYIEVANMSKNLEALEQVIDFGYDTTVYFEITFPNGKTEIQKNITKFAKDNNLNVSCLTDLINGRLRQYKGFRGKRINKESVTTN